MDTITTLRQAIDDLELKLANNRKMLDVAWNSAIRAAMDQFGVAHKPRCTRSPCVACTVRETLEPLIRDGNLNRKDSREIVGDFVASAGKNTKLIGKERRAYLKGVHDLFDELIRKGLV